MKRYIWAGIALGIILLAGVGLYVFERSGGETDSDGEDQGGSEVVDPGVLGSVPVIAVDEENNPHIIFYETENQDLKYASYDGDSWQSETVDSKGNIGDGHDLAIDQDGNPHISYRDKTNGSVKYATKIGGSWKIETLDDPAGKGESVECSSIAIDSNGNPHIAYNIQSKSEPYIEYAWWSGSSWHRGTTGIEGHWPNLALDSNDDPHIVFHDDMKSRVFYAARLPLGKWRKREVDSSVSVENDPRIVVDSVGFPHIAYRGAGGSCPIKYASWTGSSWDVQTVAEGEQPLDELDIALDADDKPYLVYGAPSKGTVLAILEDGGWVYKVVDATAHVCAVAVDRLNRAHVAFTYGVGEGDGPADSEIIKYILVEK